MFSYLEVVKKLVQPEIYNRGLKLYLEGAVLGYSDLLLDYWRKYQVQNKNNLYTVDIPLLHLALDKQKHPQASQALKEVVRCDSPYFLEFGICANVVAVCAALDQEFSPNQIKISKSKNQPKINIWDNILQAESTKKQREWLNALEKCVYYGFSDSSQQYKTLKKYFADILTNPDFTFIQNINSLIDNIVGNYLLEKNLLKIFIDPYFLASGSIVWWKLISPFFQQIDTDHQLTIACELWKNKIANNVSAFEEQIREYFVKLPSAQKLAILEKLKKQYSSNTEFWLEFTVWAEYIEWLEEHIDELDSKYLIVVAKKIPDQRDRIEQKIVEQIKIWSDFLIAGDYQELIQILSLWKTQLGYSDYLEDVLRYIKQSHHKKTKLLKALEKI